MVIREILLTEILDKGKMSKTSIGGGVVKGPLGPLGAELEKGV